MAEPLVNATPERALAAWFALLEREAAVAPTAVVRRPLADAHELVAAEDVVALQPSPPFRVAAMDGIAVRAGEVGEVPATLSAGQFAPVDTGEAIADEWDAVVPVEDVEAHPEGVVVRAAAVSGRHVRPVGEDIPAGIVVVAAGRRLGPYELALAASCGHAELAVRARPRVAILPTGDELRPAGTTLAAGEAAESNGVMLAALVRAAGGEPTLLPLERDDPDAIARAVREAAGGCELLLVLAGSSRGQRDHTGPVLDALGEIAVHGVALRPGHPVILGCVEATPVIGVPGYPVSAAQAFSRFALPLLARRCAAAAQPSVPLRVELAVALAAHATAEVMVPVRLEPRAGDVPLAHPLRRKGAALREFASADAVVHVPRGLGLAAGVVVDAAPRPGG